MYRQMHRLALLLPIAFVSLTALSAQQTQTPPQKVTPPSYSAIPAEAAKQANPVKSSPESLARAKRWWGMDCAMCHGKDGDGKGDVATSMKLAIVDLHQSRHPQRAYRRGDSSTSSRTATRTCQPKASASSRKKTGISSTTSGRSRRQSRSRSSRVIFASVRVARVPRPRSRGHIVRA